VVRLIVVRSLSGGSPRGARIISVLRIVALARNLRQQCFLVMLSRQGYMASEQVLILTHIISHGLFFAFIATGYLLIIMIAFGPRVWGLQDYPKAIKEKVPPQTRKEKALAVIIGLPWLLFVLGFPLVSTYMLRTQLSGEISFVAAFLSVFVLLFLFNISDLVILDWLIISRITPRFVIIPGTEVKDYKDLSQHYKGHVWGTIGLILLSSIFAAIASFF
jgi:hypothetical protein